MAPVVEVSDAGHCRSLLLELNEQRLRGQFCDVTIIAEDTKFRAHKNVLAASSPFFKRALAQEAACPNPAQVLELPGVQAGVFSDVLNFIYNSRLAVASQAAARELGAVGRRLGIPCLQGLEGGSPKEAVGVKNGSWSPVDLSGAGGEVAAAAAVARSGSSSSSTSTSSSNSSSSSSSSSTESMELVVVASESRLGASESRLGPLESRLRSSEPLGSSKSTLGSSEPVLGSSECLASSKSTLESSKLRLGSSEARLRSSESTLRSPEPALGSPEPTLGPPEGSSPLCCGLCGRVFSTAAALAFHAKLHRGRRGLACRHCGKSFIHVKRLQTHEVICKDNHPQPTTPATTTPTTTATIPTTTTPPSRPPPPPPPAPKQGKKALLLRHRALEPVTPEREEEESATVKTVDGHLVYLCGVCQRSYMTLSSLKRHANVHSWRRKYPCRYCDKVFALAEYRTKHEVWHTGERRYQCIFCWDTFVTYYNLKTHQKAFHGINPALISSEKTPNGGYKPKLNALKLYRLLPMRAHKRPYKTYSQAAAAGGEPVEGGGGFPSPRPEQASVIAYGRPAAPPSVIVHSGAAAAAASVITYNGGGREEAGGGGGPAGGGEADEEAGPEGLHRGPACGRRGAQRAAGGWGRWGGA
ncbi:LOW QUALITY PROTEIN: zinc finger and BTB domain-containing protein 4 [Melanerpes formicivorus]|uniref:LOW QUALITY PROTEIN: zinc finger and BTB domain-containing protein 4 n=1 Tax=Melanerpes formicivorus TaxID=211600 RepID=UPI00358F55EE